MNGWKALGLALALAFAGPAHAATYQYDALGRLIHVIHDDGGTVSYTYDAAGNRTQVVATGVSALSVNDASATEGGDLTFTVTRTGVTGVAQAVSYATASGAAVAGSDFTAVSGTLTFASGETSKTVTVTTLPGTAYELSETFTLNLSAPTNGAAIADGQGLGTINDDDPAPSFAIADASAAEGDAIVFTVTKTGVTDVTHAVSYSSANGTASANDYTAASGFVTFAPGDATKTITVNTTEELHYEADETILLTLFMPTNGATISDNQATGTITNDDAPPTFAIGNATVAEGGNLVFTVTKSGPSVQVHAITYSTANGTAAATDYTAITSGTVTFPISAGDATQTITVATVQDTIYEPSETVLVNLTAITNSGTIAGSQGIGTITDNDAGPSFTINDVAVAEGGNLVFTVTKNGLTAFSHSVSYSTATNTASAADFTSTSGTLTFLAGETTKTVSIATTHEAIYELQEYMLLNLSSATGGATIGDSQGVGSINNNDAGPYFYINDQAVYEGATMTFSITKSGATEVAHAVNYITYDGSAVAGSDYYAVHYGVNFALSETVKYVSVPTVQDSIYEANETMSLNLYSPTNGSAIADSQGSGAIYNDDAGSPPVASVTGYSYARQHFDYGTGEQYYYVDAVLSGYDPDGGTAYFINGSYPNTINLEMGYFYDNPWWYAWGFTPYYVWNPSFYFYMYDTTGGSRTYLFNIGGYESAWVSPVVLDLDDDGVELVSSSVSRIRFNIGNGGPEPLGWVSADDGILVLDRDGDGQIMAAPEVSFINDVPGARSDLEGLRAFDTNADGLLDARDDRFPEFQVWRDANQNGRSESDELLSLADMQIASLDLTITPTGESIEGAADNVITGLSRFTRGDGSRGELGDVALHYRMPQFALKEVAEPLP